MSKTLYTFEVSLVNHLVMTIVCVALWGLALMFSYVILTQNISGRELYMLLAGLPLFYGLAIFISYKAIKYALHRVTLLTLTSDELRVKYQDGKEYLYPLNIYVFSIFEPQNIRTNLNITLTMSLSDDFYDTCTKKLDKAEETPENDPCESCEYSDWCEEIHPEAVKPIEVIIPAFQMKEMNTLYEKIIAAQKTLQQSNYN